MALDRMNDDVVDFDGKSIKIDTEEDAKIILEALKTKPSVTALRLSGNTIGVDGARLIGSELSSHKDLKRCLFSDMFTGTVKSKVTVLGRMVDEIAPALKQISMGIISSGAHLTELDLSDNAFGPRGVVGVTDLLSSPVCFTLKVLRMNNQGLGHQGAKYLAEALFKGINESNGKGLKLIHFSAGRNRLENVGACLLADVFSQMQSLEELHLYQNGIGIHGSDGIIALSSAISKNTQMRVLNLSDNSLKEKGGIEVARTLKWTPQLKELILDDCLIRSRGCRALAHYLEREDIVPDLCRLSLYGNEIKRNAAVFLAFSLANKSNLTYLSLNANEFGPAGVEDVLHVLSTENLLHAIAAGAPPISEEEEEDEDEDIYHRAFNEDGGGDNEDDVVEEEYELELDNYEESRGSYNDKGEDDDEKGGEEENSEMENSFATVKDSFERPTNPSGDESANRTGTSGAGGFSFLSCLSNLQKENQPRENLFAGLKLAGLTSSGGLFSNKPSLPISASSTSFEQSIFSTPTLSLLRPFDENSILELLKAAFVDTENDNSLMALIENLTRQSLPPSWRPNLEKISAFSPESVVRLAFRICQKSFLPALQNLACDLLLAALTQKSGSASTSIILPSARAVNHVLLHLSAIKPDRSDSVNRKIHMEASDSQIFTTAVDLVASMLKRHGDLLGDDIRKPLALLISQHWKENSAEQHLSYASTLLVTDRKIPLCGIGGIFSRPLPVPVAQVGLPSVESVKVLPGFLCLYDRRSRIPRWTLEHLTNGNLSGDEKDLVDRREFVFAEDFGEPPEFRSTNLDYADSGFDRGHMAAAGNNKFNADGMEKTFILSNIAPQVGYGFNRGIWNNLEKYIRGMARRSANVVVVTGPLFLPSSIPSKRGHRQVIYEVIGRNNVAVPTHFFKAVAVQGEPQGSWRTYAWVIPNREIPEGTHVNAFALPLKDVERAAGLIIFPNLYKP
ncbi:Ran GTPase-activating protein 1 [Taenia crassiceps]|uniref:Ran GTPase-activating protein 1 n=1 Tax=Taenia crassiceps TaxID=6207 RepID=A0ABR4QJL8_9CEST